MQTIMMIALLRLISEMMSGHTSQPTGSQGCSSQKDVVCDASKSVVPVAPRWRLQTKTTTLRNTTIAFTTTTATTATTTTTTKTATTVATKKRTTTPRLDAREH